MLFYELKQRFQIMPLIIKGIIRVKNIINIHIFTYYIIDRHMDRSEI